MLRGPIALLNLVSRSVHQNDAARAEDGDHPSVIHPDISVEVVAVTVGEYALEVSPLFHHPGQQFRPTRVECRVKLQGNAQGSWRSHRMSLRHMERSAIVEALLNRGVVPAKDLERIQVVNRCERVDLVQPWHDTAILNVRQPADVQNEIRAPAVRGQFVASSLHVSVSQAQFFAGLPQTKPWLHEFSPWLGGNTQGTTELPGVKNSEQNSA